MRSTSASLHNGSHQQGGEDPTRWRKGESWSHVLGKVRGTGPGIRGGIGWGREPGQVVCGNGQGGVAWCYRCAGVQVGPADILATAHSNWASEVGSKLSATRDGGGGGVEGLRV